MGKKLALTTTLMLFAVFVAGIVLFAISYYTSESYLVLKGDTKITIGLNGIYKDPGFEAVLHGRDASDKVIISGDVDPATPGDYKVEYKAGNFTMEREVTVLDEMNPVLTLNGGAIHMKLGDKFVEPGYSATDENGNDLTASVKVSSKSTNRAGKQKIKYTVTDSEGNTTQLTRDVTVEPNTKYKTSGLPICMYHYVYDEKDVPANVNGNFISTQDLTEELEFLKAQDFYFPTWQEVRDYVDGKLLLPEKSIVLTFDDGAYTFLDNGIPVLEKCKVPATSFVITSNKGKEKMKEYQSEYVDYESHSHNMHRGGGKIGHGGIFTAISHDAGLKDLKKSIKIVGSGDAFAYPFGDTNANTRQLVEEAGFLCAVTTVPGRAMPGDDPLMLPRQRMSRNQSMNAFKAMVMPFDNDKN